MLAACGQNTAVPEYRSERGLERQRTSRIEGLQRQSELGGQVELAPRVT